MRSSTVLSLVALTAVAPSLAAPVAPAPQYTKRQTTSQEKRESSEESGAFAPIFAPIRRPFPGFPSDQRFAVARTEDESGAFPWGKVLSTAASVLPLFLKRDDLEELFSRGHDEQIAHEFGEHVARALVAGDDNQSGAFPWGTVLKWAPTVISAVSSFFNKRDIEEVLARGYDEQLAREFEDHIARELLARDDFDLQSGAFPWAAVFKAAPTIISAANSIYDIFKHKREFEELFTRELAASGVDESGAFPWGTVLKWAPTVISAVSSFFNKRDIEEVLARGYDEQLAREFEDHITRELLARDDLDLQSGAFPWRAVFKAAPTIISAATSIYDLFKHKRDLEGLFTREVQAAQGDDESGAFWGLLLRAAPTIISAVSSLIHKREFEDLLTRSVLEARSLNELD
jgi:hypothetical protein